MDVNQGETVIFEGHPSWRATLAFYFKGIVASLVAGGVAYLVTAIGGDSDIAIAALVVVAGIVLTLLVGFLKRWATVYSITNQRLRIKRGIIARHVQETRLERVQNVNTNQSATERVLQVGTVDFDTAGSGDADFAFWGVSRPEQVVHKVDQAQRQHAEELGGVSGDPHPYPGEAQG
jgi:uncharacterized membrane protein YdbT with pleckstrin-like domain